MLAVSAATATTGAVPPRAAAPVCRYPTGVVANQWQAVPPPAGAQAPVSLHQLDQDPCVVLAADRAGARWRSTDAGAHWTALGSHPRTTRLFTERLQPRVGAGPVGPVIATGPAESDDALPQVYVSDDGGVTFEAARLAVDQQVTPLPVAVPVPVEVPLRMDVAGATTAVHYAGGTANPYVYLAGLARPASLPAGSPVAGAASLLKSTDGGHTFRTVAGAQRLRPTVIAVNPTSQDEIWVNDAQGTRGGGAWVSYDGGTTFSPGCCPESSVRDITIAAAPDGGIVVLLATDAGLLRSVDDGTSWEPLFGLPVSQVRTPPDDPGTVLVDSAEGVTMSRGAGTVFTPLPGLPAGCAARGLRRDDRVPSTFLVECGATTLRLLLTRYAGSLAPGGGTTGPLPPIGGLPPTLPVGRPLVELASWALPDSNSATGTIAFDGSILYYDQNRPGDIGRIRASDGVPLPPLQTEAVVVSLTVDLRRNQLLVTTGTSELLAFDLRTGQRRNVGLPPTKVPSYDSAHDGLAWIPEGAGTMYRRSIAGMGPGDAGCTWAGTQVGAGVQGTSTFVAAGDGGGYVQDEDDATLFRIDAACNTVGVYRHRTFSESGAENDAMACDTQSYFPQPAIWIRDSAPQSVTAYGVPFGYCPMPSRLTLRLARDVYAGSPTSLCAELRNATNGSPAADRGVAVSVDGVVAGHGQTDRNGLVCVPYVPAGGFVGRRLEAVTARFAGDSALYPSSATGPLSVLDGRPLPPAPPHPAVVVPVPPAPAPAVPPNPVPNPGPGGAPAQAPAPEGAQAQAGQMQAQGNSVAQGVVVPQRQQQPQLALARAANQIGVENNAMVAPARRRRPVPVDGPSVAVVLAVACFATAGAARTAAARVRTKEVHR
ncbi:MAG: Photosynthesis system assembly factor [Frankiaceae bacterium]|nr:Photosynthesis system assembly factor [Frankiaceae bacterium]